MDGGKIIPTIVITSRHILTGLGVYYYIQFLLYLRLNLEGRRKEFNFVWKLGFLPHVDRKKGTEANGSMNGTKVNGLKDE